MASHLSRLYAVAREQLIPLDVSLELTERCNFSCRHCYLPRGNARLAEARALALVEELADLGTLFLTVTGGEALLDGSWEAVVRKARRAGFAVTLLTNASLVVDRTADLLADLRVRVGVSLYSLDGATFDSITGVEGSAAAARAGLERLCSRGVDVTVKVPLMTINLGHEDQVRAYAKQLGADCQVYTDLFARRDGNASPLRWRVPALAARLEREPPGALSAPAEVDADRPLCGAGLWHAHVTATGKLLACGVLPDVVGDIQTHSFTSVWQGSPLLKTLRELRWADLDQCSSCSWIARCGRCHAQALQEHGTVAAPSSVACDRARRLSELR